MFETERLLLRKPAIGDVPSLFQFLGDRVAMKYTHHYVTMEACAAAVARHERQRNVVGCAPWTALRKADQKIIGWGGLCEDPFAPGWGIEIVYFFSTDAWGTGYATELARYCVWFSREELNLQEARAFVHRCNIASQRVLVKSGLTEERYIPELDRLLFSKAFTSEDEIG